MQGLLTNCGVLEIQPVTDQGIPQLAGGIETEGPKRKLRSLALVNASSDTMRRAENVGLTGWIDAVTRL